MPDEYDRAVADHDSERVMAFKRIMEEYHEPRRRRKEMLKWWREHPSPRTPAEQIRNLKRAMWN